ncbi:PmoA family protein [Actinosynnema sp. NPDC023794]
MNELRVRHDLGVSVAVRDGDGDVELFRYVYCPDTVQLESPKPYIHPLRTRAGNVVSLFRPHDHVWHKGIAWSLPHVGEENFWGGPTYVHGSFYVQLDNNGTQAHRRTVALDRSGGTATFTHDLDWTTQAGELFFTERRTLRASLIGLRAWALEFDTRMTNVSGAAVAIGSPTTKGRENAGYGGLFWRGPRSFTGGQFVSAEGTGGDEVRGKRMEWLAFAGRQDGTAAQSLVLMVDDTANPNHPPQWFARTEEFACLNPAPFFSEELTVEHGATARFRYGVGIADADPGAAAELADAVRRLLGRSGTPGDAERPTPHAGKENRR